MNIVITMAGMGTRFRNAGYNVPKYQIEARGRTLFQWSMESLTGFQNDTNSYYFVVRRADNSEEFIKNTCKEMGIEQIRIISIDAMTDGQATSAMLCAPFWDKEDGLMIYNIDTYVEAGCMNQSQIRGDGFIPCFHAPGDHWSFVRLDDSGKAAEVKEKERISDNCTLGAYYFKTAQLYENLYEEYYNQRTDRSDDEPAAQRKERYIAPMYGYLIKKGGQVYISNIESSKVHVLGTPEELKVFIDEQN